MRYGLSLVTVALLATIANAQPFTFTATNIMVERVGGTQAFGAGASALSNAATAVFLDQFLPNVAGQTVPQDTAGPGLSIALPTTAGTSGNPLAVTVSGTATSEGYFSRSADGLSLIVGGYNATVGTASVASSDPATIARTIAVISETSLNSLNAFNDGGNINMRSAASSNGSDLYGVAGGGTGSIRFKSADGMISSSTSVAAGNIRNLVIAGNSLFMSSGAAATAGISLVGSAGTLPTTSTALTPLPGTNTSGTGTPSSYAFALFDNPLNANDWNSTGFDTLYVADDRSIANGGGIQRWVFDGTTWLLTGTFNNGGTNFYRGLTASISGTTVTLFATTANTASANLLVTFNDSLSAGGGTFDLSSVTLATAPANTVFRGVAFAPVPEPAAILSICAGAGWLGGIVVRRRMKR